MSWATLLARDGARFLAEFGEATTYTPSGGSALTRTAIVERNPMKPGQPGLGFQQAGVEYWIRNDATAGITSVKEGLDKVALKLKDGDSTNTTLIVKRILESDAGFFHLELGK